MGIYFAIFFLIAIGGLINLLKKDRVADVIYIAFVICILTLLAGLRYETGVDYNNYNIIYNHSSNASILVDNDYGLVANVEIGYLFLNLIFNFFHMPFNALLAFMALSTLIILTKGISKYNKNLITVSLLIYFARFFLTREMGQVRAGLACAILLYASHYLEEKRNLRYFSCILLASFFHVVSYIGIVFFFFYKIKFTTKNLIILISAGLLLGSINWLVLFANFFQSFFTPELYNTYFNETHTSSLGILNPVFLAQLVFLLLFYLFREKLSHHLTYYNVVLKAYLFSTIWLVAFNHLAAVGGRVSTVHATFEIIVIASFLSLIKEKFLVYFFLILYYMFILYFTLWKEGAYIPYRSILFQ